MATAVWEGGAATTAQVATLTPGGTIEADDRFLVTLTDENGGTATVNVAAGGTTVAAVCTAVQAACEASTNAMFQRITWADNTTNITATAKVAGVPFYISVSTTESGGGAADAQTFGAAATTANTGPNDWNTAGNWSTGSVPSASDDVLIMDSAYPILYGLDQSSVALGDLRRGRAMQGDAGDRVQGFDLLVDATNIIVEGSGGVFRWSGTATTVIITGTSPDTDAVVLGGTITTLVVSGPRVIGQVRCKANTALTTLDMNRMPAQGRVQVDSGTTAPTTVRQSAGRLDFDGGTITGLTVAGGLCVLDGDTACTAADVLGAGTIDDRSAGTITTLTCSGGTWTAENSLASSKTVTNTTVTGGVVNARNSLGNIRFTNNPVVQGSGQLISDTGVSVNPDV